MNVSLDFTINGSVPCALQPLHDKFSVCAVSAIELSSDVFVGAFSDTCLFLQDVVEKSQACGEADGKPVKSF